MPRSKKTKTAPPPPPPASPPPPPSTWEELDIPEWADLRQEIGERFGLTRILASIWKSVTQSDKPPEDGSRLFFRFNSDPEEVKAGGRHAHGPTPPWAMPPQPLGLSIVHTANEPTAQPLGLSPITCIDNAPTLTPQQVLGFSPVTWIDTQPATPPRQPTLGLSPITCTDFPPAEKTPPTRKRKGKQPSEKTPYEIKRRLDQKEAEKIANSPPIGTPATAVATTTPTAEPPTPTPTPTPPTPAETAPAPKPKPTGKRQKNSKPRSNSQNRRHHHFESRRRGTRNLLKEGLGKGEEVAGGWE